ncbi:MAG: transporter substrate-binding domain-containing protein [Alphaproteobacteria bacterium]
MKNMFITIILALLATFVGVKVFAPAGTATAAQETAYARVMRTGVIRCGYADWPPAMLNKDANTGEMTGVAYDIAEAIAKNLNLKLEWAENTGWGGYITALQNGRIDAFCAGVWRDADTGKFVAFTQPIFYSPVYGYVRADDHRFDADVSLANHAGIRISAMDGEQSDVIAQAYFPLAQRVSVQQMGQISDILMNVANNKADIVFTEPSFANGYMKNNPNVLRKVSEKPYQLYQTSPISVEIREVQLREMLDNALTQLVNFGRVDKIIRKHIHNADEYIPATKLYQLKRED